MVTTSRRQFLEGLYRVVVAAGAGSLMSFEDLLAAEAGAPRPNLVWLHGTSCSGCSVALLDIEEASVLDLLTVFTRLIFHPDLSLATGSQVPAILEGLVASGEPYLFAFEGGLPAGLPHACMLAGRPMTEWVEKLARGASLCIAVGTCAASGGVPRMAGTVTGSLALGDFLGDHGIDKPLVNLPGCPMRPEHFVHTLLHAARGRLPELDAERRPKRFFEHTVHYRCTHYGAYQESHFARFIGDSGCLFKLGCQGPVTYNDCLVTGHNGNTNSCIRAGHPCIGCASEHFPRPIMLHAHDDPRLAEGLLGKRSPRKGG